MEKDRIYGKKREKGAITLFVLLGSSLDKLLVPHPVKAIINIPIRNILHNFFNLFILISMDLTHSHLH